MDEFRNSHTGIEVAEEVNQTYNLLLKLLIHHDIRW